jgi:C-terminal processing protease CtpA/Prc
LGRICFDWGKRSNQPMSHDNLNRAIREEIFRQTVLTVRRRLYDPAMNGVDWEQIADSHSTRILGAETRDQFEAQMNEMIRELRVSHSGFFSESSPRASAKIAIGATFFAARDRWMFQDVHAGGPAHKAGIEPGDTLVAIEGKVWPTPEMPTFALGQDLAVEIDRRNGARAAVKICVPVSKKKNRPLVEVKPAIWTVLPGDIGYLKIAMFPGVVGVDLARDIDRALREMNCDRLVIDLRGNSGGGMGCLRVMSYLTPDRFGVGYSVTRKDIERSDFDKHRLPAFDRIPDSKLGLIPLLLRFAARGRSVAVFTERRGPQRFHGNIVLVVNEHSASSAEMVAAFAKEYRLATIVGAKTSGRLLGGDSFRVRHGYRVALPVVEYRTWRDVRLEGKGVEPDISVPFDPAALRNGRDTQLNAALDVISHGSAQRAVTG